VGAKLRIPLNTNAIVTITSEVFMLDSFLIADDKTIIPGA